MAFAVSLVAISALLAAVCILSASHSVVRARVPVGVETAGRADLYGRRAGAINLAAPHRLVIDTPDHRDQPYDGREATVRSAPVDAGCGGNRTGRPAAPVAADLSVAGRDDLAGPPCVTADETRALAAPAASLLLAPDAPVQLATSLTPPSPVPTSIPANQGTLAGADDATLHTASITPRLASTGPRLASLGPTFGPRVRGEDAVSNSTSLPPLDGRTAVYDITARKVYLPNGKALEAHSGLGRRMDDPRFVHVRNQGATPPNVYDLSLREQLFHGVRAIRLTPVAGSKMFGRDGMLAHSYLLGPNGQSHGCVSFRDYPAFLQAFLKGEVKRLVVVARLPSPPTHAIMARGAGGDRQAANTN
jgi:Protein of unknown function (DUF2778)